jgi:hypothetical protein
MDIFEPGSLVASLVVSSIGLGLFLYGKRRGRWLHLFSGLALMVFPYFVPQVPWMIAVAAALIGATWLATRLGW